MPIVVGVNTASSIDVGDQSYSINKVATGALAVDFIISGSGYPTLNASGALTLFPVVDVIAVHPVIRNGPGIVDLPVDLSGTAGEVGYSYAVGSLPVDVSVTGDASTTFIGTGSLPIGVNLSGIGESDGLIGGGGALPVDVNLAGTGSTTLNITASGTLVHGELEISGTGLDKLGVQASGNLLLPGVELSGQYVEQRAVFFVASVYIAPYINTAEVDTEPYLAIDGVKVRTTTGNNS
jgi:hypothetical protein